MDRRMRRMVIGWLIFCRAFMFLRWSRRMESLIAQAIALAPRQPAPRLYYAIVADSTPGNQPLAKSEFEVFLALRPSAGQLAIARPFLVKLGLKS